MGEEGWDGMEVGCGERDGRCVESEESSGLVDAGKGDLEMISRNVRSLLFDYGSSHQYQQD